MKTNIIDRVAIILLLTVMIISMCVVFVNAEENRYYADVGVVIELDEEENIVYVENFFGQVWMLEGTEDWFVGDIVAMVFDTMGTELIYDDEIVNARYAGYVSIV